MTDQDTVICSNCGTILDHKYRVIQGPNPKYAKELQDDEIRISIFKTPGYCPVCNTKNIHIFKTDLSWLKKIQAPQIGLL